MVLDSEDEAIDMEILLSDDAPLVIVDGVPVPFSAVKLVNGILVDETGRRAAALKPQTFYAI